MTIISTIHLKRLTAPVYLTIVVKNKSGIVGKEKIQEEINKMKKEMSRDEFEDVTLEGIAEKLQEKKLFEILSSDMFEVTF